MMMMGKQWVKGEVWVTIGHVECLLPATYAELQQTVCDVFGWWMYPPNGRALLEMTVEGSDLTHCSSLPEHYATALERCRGGKVISLISPHCGHGSGSPWSSA